MASSNSLNVTEARAEATPFEPISFLVTKCGKTCGWRVWK